jgi:membrane protein
MRKTLKRRAVMRTLPKNRFLRGCLLLARRYLRHSVGIQSAALAFYLLFMTFPFLIFISALLGLLQLDVAAILLALQEILPREIVDFVEMYLTYVAANPSPRLLLFGLVFSLYFPMRAANSLMRSVRTAYHLGPPPGAVRHWLKTLLYTVMLILSIALTLTLMTVGERLLNWLVESFSLPAFLAEIWSVLRFPAAAVVGYFALFFLYALSQDARQPWRNIWPGTLAALAAWMALSWLYAYYVDHIAHYSSLYGSIGAVIVLLIWLYLSAMVLIMGAEFNGTLMSLRKDRMEKPSDSLYNPGKMI